MGFDYSENSDGTGGVNEVITKEYEHEKVMIVWIPLILTIIGFISLLVGLLFF